MTMEKLIIFIKGNKKIISSYFKKREKISGVFILINIYILGFDLHGVLLPNCRAKSLLSTWDMVSFLL